MAVLLLVSAPGAAQEQSQLTTADGWYKYGVPFPDMDGPVPRMPDGKPDLSGQWATLRRADITADRIPGSILTFPQNQVQVESEEFGELSPPSWLLESGKLEEFSKVAERPAFPQRVSPAIRNCSGLRNPSELCGRTVL